MKQNPNYILCQISNVPYLLPVGQAIADHKRGLKTNATGVFLWNLLKKEHTLDEILMECASYYEIPREQLPEFRQDITHFIQQLCAYDILIDSEKLTDNTCVYSQLQASRDTALKLKEHPSLFAEPRKYLLSIGGLTLSLLCPPEAFPSEFTSFLIKEYSSGSYSIHQEIILHSGCPTRHTEGTVLLQNKDLIILEEKTQYLLFFPSAKNHLEIHINKAGSIAHCYCLPPYHHDFHYDFFHAVRLVYLYLAQQHNMVALHSASILYQDKLWLFSGQSGTGKSTHTNLWNRLYHTPIINGDLNLLSTVNDIPVVHGIPWCGTSGICSTKTYTLGGIILLKQAEENHIEFLSPDQKIVSVSQRLISPAWNKEMWNKTLEYISSLEEHILICKLHCTKEKEAVDTIKEEIDHNLI